MWKQWLSRLEGPRGEQHPPHDIALAVLLLECARADFEHVPVELDAVREGLAAQLALPGPITRLNRELSAQGKRDLMGWLWRVACADGRIDPHEEHLLRKLADLLHVSHTDFIRSKLAAQERPPA